MRMHHRFTLTRAALVLGAALLLLLASASVAAAAPLTVSRLTAEFSGIRPVLPRAIFGSRQAARLPHGVHARDITPQAVNQVALAAYPFAGKLAVDGVVSNGLGRMVTDIEVTVQFLDASDQVLETTTTYTDLYGVKPGMWAAWSLPPLDAPAGWTRISATAEGYQIAKGFPGPYLMSTTLASPTQSGADRDYKATISNKTGKRLKGIVCSSWESTPGAFVDEIGRYLGSYQLADKSTLTTHVVGYAPLADTTDLSSGNSLSEGLEVMSVQLKASTLTPVRGSKMTLTATLKDSTGKVFWDEGGMMFESADGKKWKPLASDWMFVNDSGNYAVSKYPAKKTYYIFDTVYIDTWTGTARAVSNSVCVMPKAVLSTPSAPSSVTHGKNFTITGKIDPGHTAGTNAVTLYIERKSGAKWVAFTHVSGKLKDKWNYAGTVKLGSKGSFRVRAKHADGDHSTSYSLWRNFTAK